MFLPSEALAWMGADIAKVENPKGGEALPAEAVIEDHDLIGSPLPLAYEPVPVQPLVRVCTSIGSDRFAPDSLLEGERFELSVPLDRDDGFGLSSPARLLPERDPTVRNPLAPSQNLPYDAARGFTDWCRRTAEAMAKTRPP